MTPFQDMLAWPAVYVSEQSVSHSWIESSSVIGMALTHVGSCSKFLWTTTMSKFEDRMVHRSKWTCSTSSSSTMKNGVSVSVTRQCTVGWMSTISRCGTPWNPRSRYGMSNSRSCEWCLATFSSFLQKSLNISFSFFRSCLSRCSSSSSSGSYMLRDAASSATEASTTSVKNCTSLDFFLPIMMPWWRWKWIRTMTSFSQGWNSACLMLAYMTSRISCFFDVNRRPFECASNVPVVFLPDMKGRMVRSAMRGTRWSRIFTSLSWATRPASSAFFAADARDRLRSSWIMRYAAASLRGSRDR
mmetsp:Transcript_1679/g.5061  ORF Transcript_1679/g.5061 Transcript_1679/m.5061 type:complete len:301 (-) Transcript_1679:1931-2833(-)